MNQLERVEKDNNKRKPNIRISIRITAVVLVIFILASLICLFSFQQSLDKLSENSKRKVVESVASLVSSSHTSVARIFIYLQRSRAGVSSYQEIGSEFRSAIRERRATTVGQPLDNLLKAMVDSGLLGFEAGYFAVPPTPGVNEKPVVVASSDGKLISEEVPDEVAAIVNGKKNYRLFEDGIPQMGLEGEYLVTSYRLSEGEASGDLLWYFDFKPMGKLLNGIESFYEKESRAALLTLLLVIALSIIGLVIISFLVLGYLIKTRISKPIDELSQAAEEVMQGDFDVRLKIKPREEFSDLKRAFNKMIAGMSRVIAMALDRQPAGDEFDDADSENNGSSRHLKPRSTILFQVIALYTIVFLVAGAFFIISINNSMDSLVDRSKETLIETEANLIISSHGYGSALLSLFYGETQDPNAPTDKFIREFLNALSSKTVSEFQRNLNQSVSIMVDNRLFNYSAIICVVSPGPLVDDYTIAVSSDDKYMYKKPPDEVLKLFDKEPNSFIFYEDGIPGMGYNEPYLATSYQPEMSTLDARGILLIDFKPMGKEVKAIDSFYKSKKNYLMLTMGLVTGISILILVCITFLTLAHLIRKQITGPIDELVEAAGRVMEGDLEVQVQIRPGEDLESLKVAFNEMIKALSDLVEKSTGV